MRKAEHDKPRLLFLSHRIPYPPDKGDKIRSWHWVQALADKFRVHLGAFVDDPRDWQHRRTLAALCAELYLLPLPPRRAKLRSLSGLVTGEALTLPYYRDRKMRDWVARCASSHPFGHVFVFSSAMAQYAAVPELAKARRVIDFVDVDSDKWRQYAERERGPMGWLYRREAATLETFEEAVAEAFDASLFVSSAEAALFRARPGGDVEGVTHVDNGVDSAWFDPSLPFDNPYPEGASALVFTGAMDYWANIDGVTWFVQEVWPEVCKRVSQAVFYIVGARPSSAVARLANESVRVTGRVPDVRPYLCHAHAVVAPMRIARGVQNKVLEGMSMARPVVVTSAGLEGIPAADGHEVLLADDAKDFAQRVVQALSGGAPGLGEAARALVRREYAWRDHCQRLVELVAGACPQGHSRGAVDSQDRREHAPGLPRPPGARRRTEHRSPLAR